MDKVLGNKSNGLGYRPILRSSSFLFVYCLFVISCLSFPSVVSAQKTFTERLTSAPRTGEGSVVIKQDAEIEALVNGKGAVGNARTQNATPQRADTISSTDVELGMPTLLTGKRARLRGYRIQVFAGGNSREGKQEALRMQNLVRSQFPDLAVYTQFISPRWICRVGDFRTYEEASKMLQEMRQTGRFREASIVKSTIIYSY